MQSSDSLAALAAVQCWLNFWDRLVVPVYAALSAIAPLALAAPARRRRQSHCRHPILLFGRLASHGKTLHCDPDDGSTISSRGNDKATPVASRSTAQETTTSSVVISGWNLFCDEIYRTDGWFYVPKRCFAHFYLVGIVQLIACASVRTGSSPPWTVVWLLLGSHLVRRYGECLYVHKWTQQSRMHVAGYLLGIIHYLLLPLVFCTEGASTTANPNARSTINSEYVRSGSRFVGQVACVVLCLYAQYQQHRHHCTLANLRISSKSSISSAPYAIPTGGWFRLVSSPHYLAEILVYASLVLLASLLADEGSSFASSRQQHLRRWALLFWVVDNLTVSAISTHRWYLRRFPDEYAKLNRKAIVPHLL
jgi:3-oxo-5-alpha-steroid 4-dehydrogenase